MNKIIFLITISLNSLVFGQIGVGTDTPSQSAMVDLVSPVKGFSGSHISLQSATDKTTIPNPADGLLVYNTNTTSDLEPGYYVWIVNKWTASKPTLNLEVTTNGELVELLGYEANGVAPQTPTNFVSEGRTFTALGCKKWSGNEHTYCAYKSSTPHNWQEAFNASKSQKGYLVTFTSLDEWNWVKTNLIDETNSTNGTTGYDLSSSIWIGYNKVDFAGNPTEFTWITGEKSKTNWETLVTEHNFNTGEPNNQNNEEGCVHIINKTINPDRKWNDIPCGSGASGWSSPWEHLIIEFNQ
ncbi:C-type lectin domain-containing protein [Empedobacter falsenii]|uniref:C-type lectin domain-containing protein n=1 Tax=Empedobacter falsenii TaxID=343874 RepID=UPI0025754C4E|nr:C-type lectin domain-containing protein [Empedobacter falsenii]MDM1299905.1 C-type lectin domain-containing protein [Empedobacter falsenii]MDM1319698.1 C-type lectin domain-containing protein [Empedobacter falsenii]